LDLKTVVKAVLTGLQRGKKDFGIEYGFIWDTLRFHDATVSMSDITAALELRDQGVVGYDLAGPEKGFPVKIHKEALELAIKNNFNITLHAGEAYGKDSIAQALRYGAHRLGHACTLIEDVKHEGTKIVSMGKLAQYVLDKRVTLEMCPTSNLDTGALTDLKDHPFPVFFHNDFRVTLNTDNRLMSGVTLTDEYDRAARLFELNLEHLETLSINAMKSAFANYDLRKKMINDVIRPAFAKAKLQLQNDPTSVLEAL
jgi:adenosine deaminase